VLSGQQVWQDSRPGGLKGWKASMACRPAKLAGHFYQAISAGIPSGLADQKPGMPAGLADHRGLKTSRVGRTAMLKDHQG
jgi:hypothetical protein